MSAGEERAMLAREVVELGEELFELALRGYAGLEDETTNEPSSLRAPEASAGAPFTGEKVPSPAGSEGKATSENAPVNVAAALAPAAPVEELRAAADELFRVLRRLLDVE